jgi:hypothetical protein
MTKSPYWCPNCHQDTLKPTGRRAQFASHTEADPPPIDAHEFWEWECENPVCEERWRALGQNGPWRSARKRDGSPTRDPRWSKQIKPQRRI